jgi:hypothetical protein
MGRGDAATGLKKITRQRRNWRVKSSIFPNQKFESETLFLVKTYRRSAPKQYPCPTSLPNRPHKNTSSSFPTIFPKFKDLNYFLLPYTNLHHNKFP